MMFVVDRFEGDKAVLVFKGHTVIILKAWLPTTTKEGDVLDVSFSVNAAETKKRLSHISTLTQKVFGNH